MLGQILGASGDAGNGINQWILRVDGVTIPCQMARPLTKEEISNPFKIIKQKAFDESVHKRLGRSSKEPSIGTDPTDFLCI